MADAVSEVAPPPQDDAFDLAEAAAEFYDRFPAYAGRVSFVDVTSGAIINSDPAKVQELIGTFSTEEGRQFLGPIIGHCRKTRTPYTQFAEDGDAIIFMYTKDDGPRYFSDAIPKGRAMRFVFDHETGHVVVPEGSSDIRLKAENAADAFALLCDLERHGDLDLAEEALLFRTSYALFNAKGMINFSSPMIEKFIADHDTLAKEKLTADKIVSLSGEFANHDTMPEDKAVTLMQSLEGLRRLPSLDTLTHITLETPLPDTFKWTSTILKSILSGHGSIPGTTAEAFNQACREVPPKMKQREMQFSRPAKTAGAAPLPA